MKTNGTRMSAVITLWVSSQSTRLSCSWWMAVTSFHHSPQLLTVVVKECIVICSMLVNNQKMYWVSYISGTKENAQSWCQLVIESYGGCKYHRALGGLRSQGSLLSELQQAKCLQVIASNHCFTWSYRITCYDQTSFTRVCNQKSANFPGPSRGPLYCLRKALADKLLWNQQYICLQTPSACHPPLMDLRSYLLLK